MNFTINGESYSFTLQTDGAGNLTAFTAIKDGTTYDCAIQLTSRVNAEDQSCCSPSGCTAGSC